MKPCVSQSHRGRTRLALASLSATTMLSSLGISSVNIALPALSEAFDASFPQVQWVVLSYLLAVTALIVGIGRLGDMVGRRRLLLVGITLFIAASVAGGLASSLWVLVTARAVQGLGGAAMMALSLSFVGEVVPKDRTGRAMGLLGTMSAVGTALGPSLGGFLVDALGWRSLLLVNGPLGLVALVLAVRGLPIDDRVAGPGPAHFDRAGWVLLALTLAAYSTAMTAEGGGVGLLAVAAVAGVLFVRTEARAPDPLVSLELFRQTALGVGMAASALVSTVMMATLVVGPFYLSRTLGLDASSVGLVVSAGPVVAALTGFPAGRAADRYGARRVVVTGLLMILAGAVALSALPEEAGVPGYVAAIVTATAGYALFQTANNTEVMADIPVDRRGLVSGGLSLSRNLGLITGASTMGAVFALGAGTADLAAAPPEAVAAGLRATFLVAACLISTALAVVAGFRTSSACR
ncbi:MFS transporter [Magnetospirillum sp. UT-4]|uniref:MFS transporter n=1 Tax=Magnetospirillum sp. UT-4 TaxID=2681467 RepID=UPI001380DC06|nr:MFS transporter [Magnetospirillum sp. UT-4]CAA7626537.1 Major facilitator superfamily MFS_1 [Magnetospirillum sp. UT-4]